MILVTGATGTIGRHVVGQLARAGVAVRAMTRDPERARGAYGASRDLPIEFVHGDFARPDTLAKPLEGVERALLVSHASEHQDRLQSNFVAAARRAGARYVVKISALGAGPNAPFASGRLHAATEARIAASGMAYTHLRPHFFMQNLLRAVAAIRGRGALFAPIADAPISLVDARDVAEIAAPLLCEPGHEGRCYDITGPEALSFGQMAAMLGRASGHAIRCVRVPRAQARDAMLERGLPGWLVGNILDLHGAFATGEWAGVRATASDITGRPARRFGDFAAEHARLFGPMIPADPASSAVGERGARGV